LHKSALRKGEEMSLTGKNLTIVLIIAGLVIGLGVGYSIAPTKTVTETIYDTETIYETITETVTVEVAPLDGTTVSLAVITGVSSEMEILKPMWEDIILPDINEFADKLGYDVKFEFLLDDAMGQPAVFLEKVQGFKSLGVNHILGCYYSSHILGARSYINENDMIAISAGSTSPLAAFPDDNIFRLVPTDFAYGTIMPDILSAYGIEAVAVMQGAEAFGDGLWNVMETALPLNNIEVLERVRFASGIKEFSTYLDLLNTIMGDAIEKYGVEHVAIIQCCLQSDGLVFHSQVAGFENLEKIIWFSTHGGRNQRMLDSVGEAIVTRRDFGMQMTPAQTWKFQEFEDRFYESVKLYPGIDQTNEYDGGILASTAILETQSIDALPSVRIFPTHAANYFGVSGWCELDINGDRKPGTYTIWGYAMIDGEPGFTAWGNYNAVDRTLTWNSDVFVEQGMTPPG